MPSSPQQHTAQGGSEPPRYHGQTGSEAASSSQSGLALAAHPLAQGTESTSVGNGASTAAGSSGVKRFVRQQVPDEILHNTALNEAIKGLPSNYNFELHKTVWRVKSAGAKNVALQFPEGLLMYATTIADILTHFAGVEHCVILGDVTYGACCVDDFSARALGCDFLVHYGHSCLVPVDVTSIPCLYVFVDIAMDVEHMVGSVRLTFPPGTNLVLAGTIQFSSGIQQARSLLSTDYPSLSIPKCRPLSPGEVLGCTAPVITTQADAIVFVADGRFHLEAIMIANPTIPAYRYDPYGRILTREQYDHVGMRAVRRKAIESARSARHWGVVLGTLGRQGNPQLVERLETALRDAGCKTTLFLMSELSPQRLALVQGIDAWVQVACPRLSIDWGEAFKQPTLTPYEAMVTLGLAPAWWEADSVRKAQQDCPTCGQQQGVSGTPQGAAQGAQAATGCATGACACKGCGSAEAAAPYPMDYYAKDGGVWNSSWHKGPSTSAGASSSSSTVAAVGGT